MVALGRRLRHHKAPSRHAQSGGIDAGEAKMQLGYLTIVAKKWIDGLHSVYEQSVGGKWDDSPLHVDVNTSTLPWRNFKFQDFGE